VVLNQLLALEATGEATLLGIAAVITAISGVISTIVGSRRSAKEAKEKAEEECREKLKVARIEAEEAAAELHRLRMEAAQRAE
jgi:Na+-transporting methylmalonyl-CoA/oxaloacetate decarboxylase gamma subunit